MDERKDIAFDNSIKSKLVDIEVRPPKGTWEAISSRLESKEKLNSQDGRWLGLVLASFCTACTAVAVALLFSPGKQSVHENQLVSVNIINAEEPKVFASALDGEINDIRFVLPSREVVKRIDKEDGQYKEDTRSDEAKTSVGFNLAEEKDESEYIDPFVDMIGQEEH